MENQFSTHEVSQILGIRTDRLAHWLVGEDGEAFIFPTERAEGSGTKRSFSRWDMYGIVLYNSLLRKGVSRKEAGKYFRAWSGDTVGRPLAERHRIKYYIIWTDSGLENGLARDDITNIDDDSPYLVFDDNNADFLKQFADMRLDEMEIFNMQKVIRRVDEQIAKFEVINGGY